MLDGILETSSIRFFIRLTREWQACKLFTVKFFAIKNCVASR